MPHSGSTIFPLPEEPQKGETGTNNDKTNATHVAHEHRRTATEEPLWND